MQTIVVYDTLFGNTEAIARAIARGAGTVGNAEVMSVAEAGQALAGRPDLLLLGGPTQRHGINHELSSFIEGLQPQVVRDVAAASFDTRYRMATLLSGSAAKDAANKLRKAGARLLVPAESFFVERDETPKGVRAAIGASHLQPGELDRAEAWGRAVAAAGSSSHSANAARA
jgi:flavodoxin